MFTHTWMQVIFQAHICIHRAFAHHSLSPSFSPPLSHTHIYTHTYIYTQSVVSGSLCSLSLSALCPPSSSSAPGLHWFPCSSSGAMHSGLSDQACPVISSSPRRFAATAACLLPSPLKTQEGSLRKMNLQSAQG